METLILSNPAYGFSQAVMRYWKPLVNSSARIGPRKFLNALYAEAERRAGRITVRSMPLVLHLDPTNICNLRCPFCATGAGENPVPKGNLTFSDFKKIFDQLKDYLVITRLDGSGEPFLNPDIYRMVEYASDSGVLSAISTNFTTLGEEGLKRILDSGLDYLIIALDGATKEVYEEYRIGANFEKVIENIESIVRLKKEYGKKNPFIEIQFIIFKHNEHQIEDMKSLSERLDVDRLVIKEGRDSLLKTEKQKGSRGVHCYWLWYALNVSLMGEIKSCCLGGLVSPFSFGNILVKDITGEWNNDAVRELRALLTGRKKKADSMLKGCNCLTCYKVPY